MARNSPCATRSDTPSTAFTRVAVRAPSSAPSKLFETFSNAMAMGAGDKAGVMRAWCHRAGAGPSGCFGSKAGLRNPALKGDDLRREKLLHFVLVRWNLPRNEYANEQLKNAGSGR